MVTIAVPPAEKKGRGTPITGMKPNTIPMFMIECEKISPVTPAQTSEPNESHLVLSISIRKQIANNKITIMIHPINPTVCPA